MPIEPVHVGDSGVPAVVEGSRGEWRVDPPALEGDFAGRTALLSPFDNLVWRRERTERMFEARYRIGLYTPAAQRDDGYYVLLFLLGERIAARVDLKADRKAGQLLVQAAHLEPGADEAHTAAALAAELRAAAAWQGLGEVVVAKKGGLATALSREFGLAQLGPLRTG